MGGFGRNNDPRDLMSLLAFRIDIRESLQGLDLGGHRWDRIEWIREAIQGEHGPRIAVLWDKFVEQGGKVPEELQEEEEDEETSLADGDRPSAAELRRLPTISESQTDNLKIDNGRFRAWLSRMTTADGMPYNNQVTIEELQAGRWVTVEEYEG